jgi:hypothetical protein
MINQAICYTQGAIQRFATSLDISKIGDLDHLERLLKEAFLHELPAAQSCKSSYPRNKDHQGWSINFSPELVERH